MFSLVADENAGPESVLPVVSAPFSGDYYTEAGTYTVTAPTAARLLTLEAGGDVYIWPESDGTETFPATWPPASNLIDGTALWLFVPRDEKRELVVKETEVFRLHVPAGSYVQVLFT